jgi:Domain of unknown function (DUF3883)
MGTAMTDLVSRRMQFVEIDSEGQARHAGSAPYLNYETPASQHAELVKRSVEAPWLQADLSALALSWASAHIVKEHFEEVTQQRQAMVRKTLEAVHTRLTREINRLSKRANEMATAVKEGKQPQVQYENARAKVEDIKSRLLARTQELESQLLLSSNPPTIAGCALILPQGLLDQAAGMPKAPDADADVRKQVELIAMNAVMDAERKLGHTVTDVSAQKCGWDVTSVPQSGGGENRHIEVKGRHIEGETVVVTANEVLEALNQGEKFLLAIVRVDGRNVDGPHYIRAPFSKELEGSVVSVNHSVKDLLKLAKPAHLV